MPRIYPDSLRDIITRHSSRLNYFSNYCIADPFVLSSADNQTSQSFLFDIISSLFFFFFEFWIFGKKSKIVSLTNNEKLICITVLRSISYDTLSINKILIEFTNDRYSIFLVRSNPAIFFKPDQFNRDAARDVSRSIKIPDKSRKREKDRRKHLSIGNNSPAVSYLELFKKRRSPSIRETRSIRIGF